MNFCDSRRYFEESHLEIALSKEGIQMDACWMASDSSRGIHLPVYASIVASYLLPRSEQNFFVEPMRMLFDRFHYRARLHTLALADAALLPFRVQSESQ